MWQDSNGQISSWLILITFADGRPPVYAISGRNTWEPDQASWEKIKANAADAKVLITILGIGELAGKKIVPCFFRLVWGITTIFMLLGSGDRTRVPLLLTRCHERRPILPKD